LFHFTNFDCEGICGLNNALAAVSESTGVGLTGKGIINKIQYINLYLSIITGFVPVF
jgi:hypothetical protein